MSIEAEGVQLTLLEELDDVRLGRGLPAVGDDPRWALRVKGGLPQSGRVVDVDHLGQLLVPAINSASAETAGLVQWGRAAGRAVHAVRGPRSGVAA